MRFQDWDLVQDAFIGDETRKIEAEMCLGNGYMSIRASDEERYDQSIPYTLIAGIFDKYGDEATELATTADVVSAFITVGGEKLDLNSGVSDYEKKLCLKDGLLTRRFVWENSKGEKIAFTSERFVSMEDKHLCASRLTVRALSDRVTLTVRTGILSSMRAGDPHYTPVEAQEENGIFFSVEQTNESKVDVVIASRLLADKGHVVTTCDGGDVLNTYDVTLCAGETFTLEKRSRLCTVRDKDYADRTTDFICDASAAALRALEGVSFDALHARSAAVWQALWDEKEPRIECEDKFDIFAVRFAIYHLTVMTPAHDDRMNIGAKGMTGPGYRGHAFWDTEIYMLPFFIFSDPAAARSLVTSRYRGLDGARRKARENGYRGAMFPWESAWVTDGEVTPSWARTGLIEHHITADVAQGVQYYYAVTGDEEFMEKYGYELIFDTAVFWQSRVQWNEPKSRYEILDVIGPDEYREDVDNNAYTNYMAWYNMKLALTYYKKLEDTPLLTALTAKLHLEKMPERWQEVCDNLYLPKPNEEGIVPQDDTFLDLQHVDLTPYKNGEKDLFSSTTEEYRRSIQHSKQADVMVLFLLLEDEFTEDIKYKNFYYYEPVCVHGSSLSLSSYTMLCADLRENDMAYSLYQKACRIDLNQNIYASGDGIHAASLGGIWQGAVLGFLGVRLYGSQLRIRPNLPASWKSMQTNIWWQGQKLCVTATHDTLTVRRVTGTEPVSFLFDGKVHTFEEEISLSCGG